MKALAAPVSEKKAPKLFHRIQEVSHLTGLKPYVLRYWETEFPELSPAKDSSDQRRYRQSDIDVVLAIRKLLYEDRYTIEGARRRLREQLRHTRRDEAAPPRAAEPVAKAPHASRKVGQSLERLRHEVNALIGLLGG